MLCQPQRPLADLDPVDTIRAAMELDGRSLTDLAKAIGRNRATAIFKRRAPVNARNDPQPKPRLAHPVRAISRGNMRYRIDIIP